MNLRKIIHIDMDAFYASVEQRDHPELKGRPVVVGGDPKSRAVVCAASYEARRFGVKSAMSCAEAYRRCPNAVFVPPNFSAYTKASEQVMEILKSVTPIIEPLSLDEAYLDVTENLLQQPSATRIAEHLKRKIFEVTQLTASAGVSYNKFLAKIASDLKKPDGLVVIRPTDFEAIVPPLPVERLWGVGKKTAERLRAMNIRTIADLRATPVGKLESELGSMGLFFSELAQGRDERPVESTWERKSVGSETTFKQDKLLIPDLLDSLAPLAQELAQFLQEKHWLAGTFTLKVKYHDFRQVTRSQTLSIPSDQPEVILDTVSALLLEKTEAGKTPIRLLGLSCSSFIREEDPLQLWFEFIR
jgi:DNA polymerase-4